MQPPSPIPVSRRGALATLAAACSGLAACSPLRVLNAVSGGDAVVQTGLPYGPGPRRQLDLYLPPPELARPAAGWPAVLFFYGGSWNNGDRADYRFVGEALAQRGIAAAVADYRLYPEVSYPAFLQDSAAAMAWLLAHAGEHGADPARIHLMGHSAGAYNAAMLALDQRWLAADGHSPRELAGWVGLAGPYDFLPTGNKDVQPVFHHPDYPRDSQPVDWASAASPRCFLGAAATDTLVDPQRSTVALATRLRAQGVAVELMLYDKPSHATLIAAFAPPLRWLAPVLDDVTTFIAA
ncbi:MAG TPA: alpha/beta hydrolase [Ideonella sp.]|nr:alpha/beta hydrolase [Ideonella sp.]